MLYYFSEDLKASEVPYLINPRVYEMIRLYDFHHIDYELAYYTILVSLFAVFGLANNTEHLPL